MVNIGPITSEIIDSCVAEVRKDENMNKIKSGVLDPLIDHIVFRIQPYIMITTLTFVLIICLSIAILYLILRSGQKSKLI